MACWWKTYALAHVTGTIVTRASWKKIVAMHYGVDRNGRGSHPKNLARLVVAAGSPGMSPSIKGPWAKRLTDVAATEGSSGARMLALNGGRPPMG